MSATNQLKMGNKNGECSQRIRSYKNTRHGTPEGTRTPDLLIRSQSLYPTELLAHISHRMLGYYSIPVPKMQVFFRNSLKCLNIVPHLLKKCKCFFRFFQLFYLPLRAALTASVFLV